MSKYKWILGDVPEKVEIRQVYGIVFDLEGRTLLGIDNGKYKMIGGKPEKIDRSIEDTLKREFLEEINITLKDIYMLGYQLVDEENGSVPYAQVRMCALIDNVYNRRPDLDNGIMYDRILTSPKKAIECLNWGDVGKDQFNAAVELAKRMYNIEYNGADDRYI